jgi:predicted aconitase with swiveling domain
VRRPGDSFETKRYGVERVIPTKVLIAGEASGPICRLRKPISFWGGVEPTTGTIIDPRHPDRGATIAGTMLVLDSTIGSSSSSAIMLELLRHDRAPAALVLGRVDAILTLGVIVASELGYAPIPVVEVTAEDLATLPYQGHLELRADGGLVTA